MNSLKGLILGVALYGVTFFMYEQSDAFVPRMNVKLSAWCCRYYEPSGGIPSDRKMECEIGGIESFMWNLDAGVFFVLKVILPHV